MHCTFVRKEINVFRGSDEEEHICLKTQAMQSIQLYITQ